MAIKKEREMEVVILAVFLPVAPVAVLAGTSLRSASRRVYHAGFHHMGEY